MDTCRKMYKGRNGQQLLRRAKRFEFSFDRQTTRRVLRYHNVKRAREGGCDQLLFHMFVFLWWTRLSIHKMCSTRTNSPKIVVLTNTKKSGQQTNKHSRATLRRSAGVFYCAVMLLLYAKYRPAVLLLLFFLRGKKNVTSFFCVTQK